MPKTPQSTILLGFNNKDMQVKNSFNINYLAFY